MKNRDLLSSIIWMGLGGLFVVGSLQHGLIRKGVPGPGFLPFISGLALIFISLFVLIPALSQREKSKSDDLFAERGSLRRFSSALAALFAFGIALEHLGFLITTFLFMFFVLRLMEPRGWGRTTLVALLTAGLSFLLFVVVLEVQLP